jgi:tryptophan halogenase
LNTQTPEKVVIVGAGVAGSMTAAYLKAAFGDRISVTLVDSPADGVPDEDESTLGDFGQFFDFLGLAEEDWMPACDATYKLAVRFQDWSSAGRHFYLPFEPVRQADGFPLTEWWLRGGPSARFDRDCFVAAWLCDAGRGPKPVGDTAAGSGAAPVPYGYHCAAGPLARLLTGYAVERGARHLTGGAVEVRLDARGWIECLLVEGHGEIDGDLFVDCTGERGLLLHRALKVPHLSYQDTLPGDGVVTLEVPADMRARGIPPYTTVSAQGAGWIWTVPLADRIGTGYAYAGEYCTPEEAERTLREYAGPEAAGVPARHGRLVSGRSLEAWRHNCVAVGPPAGRVEPLGTTGVASFAHHALEQLVRHFPGADFSPRLRDGYNAAVARSLDGAREFLTLHYQGAARDDTQYWRDTKTRPLPGEIAGQLSRWRVLPPYAEPSPLHPRGLPRHAYASLLIGTGAVPLRAPAALSLVDDTVARKEFAAVRDLGRTLTEVLPTPYEYIARRPPTSG